MAFSKLIRASNNKRASLRTSLSSKVSLGIFSELISLLLLWFPNSLILWAIAIIPSSSNTLNKNKNKNKNNDSDNDNDND